jgi:hypothetical protein
VKLHAKRFSSSAHLLSQYASVRPFVINLASSTRGHRWLFSHSAGHRLAEWLPVDPALLVHAENRQVMLVFEQQRKKGQRKDMYALHGSINI